MTDPTRSTAVFDRLLSQYINGQLTEGELFVRLLRDTRAEDRECFEQRLREPLRGRYRAWREDLGAGARLATGQGPLEPTG